VNFITVNVELDVALQYSGEIAWKLRSIRLGSLIRSAAEGGISYEKHRC
jgi:hypothetical protein